LRWLVAAALVTGCGSSEPRDCSLAAVYSDYIGSAVVDDCGNPYDDGTSGTDTAAWQAAGSCTLYHVAQHHAFLVRWTAQSLEGPMSGAYVGLSRDGQWTLSAFDQRAQITGAVPPTRRDSCTDLRATSPCSDIRSNLCIDCVDPAVADRCQP
jgi:hypothetical protein